MMMFAFFYDFLPLAMWTVHRFFLYSDSMFSRH